MKKILSTFFILWIIWILLAGFDTSEIIVGGIAVFIISLVLSQSLSYEFDGTLPLKLVKFIVIYIPLFLYKLVLSNFDMAYRVLSPSLPINPGFVKIPTKMKSDMGKWMLANSITLTPGTLSMDVDGEYVYIHWVNVTGKNEEEYRNNVSKSFDDVLGGIFK